MEITRSNFLKEEKKREKIERKRNKKKTKFQAKNKTFLTSYIPFVQER